ncbi:MFS transporter [Alicyclobacillus dauci]|uniref:MFS transporter n=1 Tax=Alicyclobacillus dauci TaxID=1475485 RepID=A0ABY6Z643_9BACL|nr:MFS transporter [Alicyclobacillus dauci]WAH37490.1 MFS transporter [Alicyclobacillus dauci]
MMSWVQSRYIMKYPVGWMRIGLLALVIIANIVANYEGELAPVVPLLLPDLHLTITNYGFIVAASAVVSAIVAVISGPWIDKYGRTFFVVAGTIVTAIAVFGMCLVHNTTQFIVVRVIMAIILGVSIPATTGLIRDFTPRVGRALGFGLWTFGPVGANYLAAGVAGATLPIFHNSWKSQFIIMGIFCLVVAIIVAFLIRDLSPGLRAQVVHDNTSVANVNHSAQAQNETIASPKLVYGSFHIWALAIGIVLFLLLYFFTQAFGPIYLVTAFKYSPAEASTLASYFWLANLVALVVIGWVSDRLQLRKIFSFIGVIGLLIFMYFWIHLIGHHVSAGTMMVYTSLQGVLLGFGFGPWMALFSENLEDIHPTLQATGWAIWSFVTNVLVAIAGSITFPVAERFGFAAWFDVCWAGVVIYGVLIFVGRGPWFRRKQFK